MTDTTAKTTITLLILLALTACEAQDKSRIQNNAARLPAVKIPQQQYIPPTKPDTVSLAALPELGDKLSGEILREIGQNRTMILTGAGDAKPMFFAEIDGVISMVSYAEDSTVVFLSVTDTTFVAPGGIKVGDHLRAVLAKTKQPAITIDTAFAFFVPLDSNWNAAFGIASLTRGLLAPDSTVTYFFRK